MVGTFFAANALLAARLVHHTPAIDHLLAAFAATLLVFFRLRIFDDIKDASRDRSEHPERPLACGLISLDEAKQAAAVSASAELAFALLAGFPVVVAWLFVFGYSLLMYREFFIGPWLRPKMELYAASHTLVAGWLGLFAAIAATSRWPWDLPHSVWILVGLNWAVFNLFEFARKSWGQDEERPGVPSYSNRWTPAGAAVLALSQAFAAAAAAAFLLRASLHSAVALGASSVLAAIGLAASLAYVMKPFHQRARIYRSTMTFFILGLYSILVLFAVQKGMCA
jgi:4-hydroxybenzoate polyprenyltransferase